MLIAPPLAEMALKFGPPEYFALMILGLTILTFLASGPMWKALLMAAFGLFLGCIGMDTHDGGDALYLRTSSSSRDGIGLVPVVMGLFGISEVLLNVEQSMERAVFETKIRDLLPTLQDWAGLDRADPPRDGHRLLPGGPAGRRGGHLLLRLLCRGEEGLQAPGEVRHGVIEGVAGPEAANNAATGGAFIPLLTLGIPANSVMAILLGALMIHGMQPGPMLVKEQPDLFWGA